MATFMPGLLRPCLRRERGVAKALAVKHGVWSLCFDLEHSPSEDLSQRELRRRIVECLEEGCFCGLGGGLPSLEGTMKAKVDAGNESARWMFSLLERGLELELVVWLENPFNLREWVKLIERWPEVKCWLVDYCRYGTLWRKRRRFYLNVAEAEQKTLCSGGHTHQLLRGRSKVHKTNWTRVAQAYPAGVCKVLAGLLVARM